jgi:HlyD family secretion protein
MTTMSATATVAARPVARRPWRIARALRWAALLIILVAAGVFAWRRLHPTSAPAVRYQTAAIDSGSIDAKVTASGAVSAIVTVQVGSQVSGRIQAWYADFSSKVQKGQLIAKIEPSLFKAAVEQAQANYTAAKASYEKTIANRLLAERNYARTLALFEQTLASRGDLDAAEAGAGAARADVGTADAAMLQSRAALDQARLNLSYTDIVSPIDGIVISRNIDVGQTVAASFQAPTLFTIAQDLTKMQVDTNVAEGDVGNVREGMTASFTVDAYPTRTFHGVVRQVRDNATTLQNVVTYDAVIDVDNADMALRPTMTANVTFVYASRKDALRIPNAALRFRPDAVTIVAMTGPAAGAAPSREGLAADQRVVWTLRGGVAGGRVVRIGISDGMTTEMLDGDLRAGDAVLTEAIPAKGP